jgi:hypothetical protein
MKIWIPSLILSLLVSLNAAAEVNQWSGLTNSDTVELSLVSFDPNNIKEDGIFGGVELTLRVEAYYTGEGIRRILLCGDSYVAQFNLGTYQQDQVITFGNGEKVFHITGDAINQAVKRSNFSNTCSGSDYKFAGLRFALYENDLIFDEYLKKASMNLPSPGYVSYLQSLDIDLQGSVITTEPAELTIDSSHDDYSPNVSLKFNVRLLAE